MFMWVFKLLRPCPAPAEASPEIKERLLQDRRRLEELLACYREFGFDALVPDCKDRIDALDQQIRRTRPEVRDSE